MNEVSSQLNEVLVQRKLRLCACAYYAECCLTGHVCMGAADDAAAAAVAVFVMIAISFRHVGRRTCARLTRPSDVCKLSAVDSRLLLLPFLL